MLLVRVIPRSIATPLGNFSKCIAAKWGLLAAAAGSPGRVAVLQRCSRDQPGAPQLRQNLLGL